MHRRRARRAAAPRPDAATRTQDRSYGPTPITTLAYSSSETARRALNPTAGEGVEGRGGLPFARLDQEAAAGGEPAGRLGGDPAQDVESVRTAVERDQRFVVAGFRGQQADLARGDVGHIGREDGDPAAQIAGQRREEVALVDLAADRADIAAGAAHRCRVDVGGVQFHLSEPGGQGGADRARAAAQVHHDRGVRNLGEGLLDEELGAAARHEDTGLHGDAQPSEPGPADDEFERQSGDPAVDHGGQFPGRAGGGQDQLRLVLREDTARGAQLGDDAGTDVGCGRANRQRGSRGKGRGSRRSRRT